MSQFNGTEGEWKVIDGKASGKQVISESAPKNRMNVASCGGQRREENANLIAAAPELLEVLQETVEALKRAWNTGALPHDIILEDLAHRQIKVIAKALGQ